MDTSPYAGEDQMMTTEELASTRTCLSYSSAGRADRISTCDLLTPRVRGLHRGQERQRLCA
jgi:hypothetical protein